MPGTRSVYTSYTLWYVLLLVERVDLRVTGTLGASGGVMAVLMAAATACNDANKARSLIPLVRSAASNWSICDKQHKKE